MRIRTRIMGASLLVVLAVSAVNTLYFIERERENALLRLRANIEDNDRLLRVVMAGPLYDGNVAQLTSNLDSFFRNPDMTRIELKENNGDIQLARVREPGGALGNALASRVDIVRGRDILGEVRTVYSTALIEMRLQESRNQFFLLSAALVLGLAVVIYVVARGMTGPIDRLTRAAGAMADGRLDREIEAEGAEELVSLGRSFNRMREAIQEKMATLAENNDKLRREMTERRRAEDALQHLNEELEQRVA